MNKTITILVVEDDETDLLNIKRTLKDMNISNPLRHARDGIEALNILRGTSDQEKNKVPILDIFRLKNATHGRSRIPERIAR